MLSIAEKEQLKEKLYREWLEAKTLIEDELEKTLNNLDPSGLPDVAKYISRGGKRFRGFLTILTAKALGGSEKDAIEAAVAIELVQAASLAIDDIVDKDTVRRNSKAAWLVHGIGKTVLSSLLLIPIAQRMVEKLGVSALYYVIRAWESTVRGEIIDVFLAESLPSAKYIELAKLKTGSLFKLATILGALAAGVKEKPVLEKIGRYGELLGIIYQLADDIADYTKYVSGEKEKLDPSEKLFIKWADEGQDDTVRNALKTLNEYLKEITKNVDELPIKDKELYTLFKFIPYFLVSKMLEEADLSLAS
ncbi:MAG: polyprenyl synthetase family protein [Desulfurococcales archaeon]|nr:polyprenyl synthetase family protein [Desulfurococcales archaeon]